MRVSSGGRRKTRDEVKGTFLKFRNAHGSENYNFNNSFF